MYVFMYTIVNNEVILTLMYEGVFFFLLNLQAL